MEIREFRSSDAEEIAALSNDNADAFRYQKVNPDFLNRMCARPDFKMFVAEAGEIVAFCGVNLTGPLPELGPICVIKDNRLHGVGSAIINHILELLSAAGSKAVVIKVKTSNTPAQEFFTALGFNEMETGSCGGIPVRIMSKEL
jgi:ribosomal protein S18 acetylase RimI-like enzyme